MVNLLGDLEIYLRGNIMKLYLLEPKECRESLNAIIDPWYDHCDMCYGIVICANDEKSARKIASENCAAEGEVAWLLEKYSTCEEITSDSERIILQHIHWC